MRRLEFILLLLCMTFIGLPGTVEAQHRVQYLQYEDMKPYHFGFLIGFNAQDLIFQHTGNVDTEGHKWYATIPSYSPGFSIGMIGDLRLADCLSLRLTPTIHFGGKEVSLTSNAADATIEQVSVRSNYIMVPLNIRYRGARSNNFRPYLMSGFSTGIDMGRDKRQPILLNPVNLYWEIGAGCDFYLPYFRLVPEIKFCLGLGDIFDHDRYDQDSEAYLKYTNSFDRITSRLIVFSLQFE
ncbi:MAG: porin family protein [Bacteroidales bacterium]|nr:porin family protein [Bacteroidales bacterium]